MTLIKCKTCLYKKNGDCFGNNEQCNDFKPVPTLKEEYKKYWPKEMRKTYPKDSDSTETSYSKGYLHNNYTKRNYTKNYSSNESEWKYNIENQGLPLVYIYFSTINIKSGLFICCSKLQLYSTREFSKAQIKQINLLNKDENFEADLLGLQHSIERMKKPGKLIIYTSSKSILGLAKRDFVVSENKTGTTILNKSQICLVKKTKKILDEHNYKFIYSSDNKQMKRVEFILTFEKSNILKKGLQ